ncbi:HD containing hydrolase-like enzyme [compost metagenome]
MLQKVEEGMVAHFIDEHIPEEFKPIFRRQLREGKDDSVEGLILEVADKLDQIYEAFIELQRGNTEKEFIVMYRNALIKVKGIKLHCVDYFLQSILPDLVSEGSRSPIDIEQITNEALAS